MDPRESTPSFQPIKLKPQKGAFLYFSFACFNLILLVLVLVGALVLKVVSQHSYLEYLLPLWAIIGIISYINAHIRYSKEVYWIYQDRLVARGGNILSNFESELIIKNITHLGLVHPFIEYHLFKTGDVIVESAGTSLAEITFRSIEDTNQIREQLIDLLKGQGFGLSQKTLQKEARQNRTGLVADSIFFTFSLVFTLALFAFGILSDLKKDKGPWPWEYLIPLIILAGIGVILMALYFFFTGLSSRYFIYADTVLERSHFLTFREVIIPMENLADVSLNQGLIKRVLSLYDNRISCQGSGKEIVFRNLKDGENIRALLGTFIQKTRENFRTTREEQRTSEEKVSSEISEEKKAKTLQSSSVFEKDFEGDFFIEGRRAYFSTCVFAGLALLLFLLLFVVVPLLPPHIMKGTNPYLIIFGVPGALLLLSLIAAIRIYIDIKATRYSLCSQSFVKNFRFLTTQLVEFTTEKVTGILIREDIPDRIVKTCTVRFDSIGSEDTLVFQHIDRDPAIRAKILAKEGIYEKNPLGELKSSFSFGKFLRANPAVIVFFIGIILGVLLGGQFNPYVPVALLGAFGVLFLPLYLFLHFYYRSATLTFFPDFIRYKIGIFTLYSHYVRYEEIKDLIATQYLFTSTGTLQFDYAGEHLSAAGGKGQQGVALVSNNFTMPYLDEVFTLRKIVDLILTGEVKAGSWDQMFPQLMNFPFKKLYQSKPKVSHGMFELSLLLVILDGVSLISLALGFQGLPLVASVGILIGLVFFNLVYVFLARLYIKSFDYIIEEDRVVMNWGIFFKAQKSVNFKKVDTIGKDQSVWHKYFKTALLSINTIGSGMTELSIDRIPDYERFYELIQKRYKG